MEKTIEYKSKSSGSSVLNEALELLSSHSMNLADGKTDFVLQFEKKDGASVLTLETIAKDADKPIANG